MEILDALFATLGHSEKQEINHSIISISNLSCAQNFH